MTYNDIERIHILYGYLISIIPLYWVLRGFVYTEDEPVYEAFGQGKILEIDSEQHFQGVVMALVTAVFWPVVVACYGIWAAFWLFWMPGERIRNTTSKRRAKKVKRLDAERVDAHVDVLIDGLATRADKRRSTRKPPVEEQQDSWFHDDLV